jgi:hypothetical protein
MLRRGARPGDAAGLCRFGGRWNGRVNDGEEEQEEEEEEEDDMAVVVVAVWL